MQFLYLFSSKISFNEADIQFIVVSEAYFAQNILGDPERDSTWVLNVMR